MQYLTSVIPLNPAFPFKIFRGSGFTTELQETEDSYMHRHQCLELNLCVCGSGRYTIGEKEYPIEVGDLFIINDLEYHRAVNLSGDMQLLVIVFHADMILHDSADYNFIRFFYEWKRDFQHRLPRDNAIGTASAALMRELEQEYKEKAVGWQLILKATLLKLLGLLYRAFEQSESYAEHIRDFQTAYNDLAPALFYIDEHLTEPIRLAELAKVVSLNPNYFSSQFSSLMGLTVSEYILRQRLRRAAGLLAATEKSVLSVALECGFNNISYFNRVFRRHFSLTPTEFRKSV